MLREDLAGGIRERDAVRAVRDGDGPPGHRVGDVVAVAAVDAGATALVDDRGTVAHACERLRGKRQQRRPVALEQLAPAHVLLVVLVAGIAVASSQQRRVERRDVVQRGHRREQVLARPADLALDVALLVAGIRVGVGHREPVVRVHPGEELRLGDLAADLAAGPRGVVEHDPVRHAAHVLEHVLEPLADALGGLAGEQPAEAHVGEGEAQREEVHAHALAAVDDVDVAEVRLRLARRPYELDERRLRRLHLGLALADVLLHDPVPARVRRLVEQPLVDSLGAMALLAPDVQVALEDRVDEGLVRVEYGAAPRLRGHLRREVVHGQVLADRRLRDPRPPLYLRVREPLAAHVAYTLDRRHVDHPFRLLAK